MMNQSPLETALSRAMIRWSLTKSIPLAETSRSWIFRVEQNGRNQAVLKILKPEAGPAETRGAQLLQWYAGDGAATVFDMQGDTIFMEWLDGPVLGDPSRNGRDAEASVAFAGVVAALHRTRPDRPADLLALRAHFEPLFRADARLWPHTARDLYARASGIALRLFDKPMAEIPLHGDLGYQSIISSDRGWLAIDPLGLLGDPHYEVAGAFRGPEGALELAADPKRIAALADVFSTRLGLGRKRLLGFAAAHSGLVACRDLSAGKPITTDLAVLPHLLSAYDQA